MKVILAVLIMMYTTLVLAANIGDTRISNDGTEQCISIQGGVETWSLVIPNQNFMAQQELDRNYIEKEHRKEQLTYNIEQLSQEIYILGVLNEDNSNKIEELKELKNQLNSI